MVELVVDQRTEAAPNNALQWDALALRARGPSFAALTRRP